MEVEAKIKVENMEKLKEKLVAMGASFSDKENHNDSYFIRKGEERATRRPGDFLLRIRDKGERKFLTFKGLTEQVGAWEEYEVLIDNPQEMERLLLRIGFTSLFTITKEREPGNLDGFEINLDRVKELGNYMEVALESEKKGRSQKKDNRIFE